MNIQSLIDTVKSGLPVRDHEAWNGIGSFLREQRTIGLVLPRQTGKTTFCARGINLDPDAVMIVPKTHIREHLISSFVVINDKQLFTPHSFTNAFIGTRRNVSKVYIDEFSFFSETQMDDIYETLSRLPLNLNTVQVIKLTT